MIENLKSKYKFLREIGQGGMAKIYLVESISTGKKMALKILHPDKVEDYAAKKRFLSEIEITKKINSPYVVKVLDAHWDHEKQYVALEYIDGVPLKEYIATKTSLTVDEVVEFGKQLTLGFDEIHRNGITHRDIKASNIMVAPHGQIKIIDFGIAINNHSESLTKTGNVIGSVQYMAPEILQNKGASKQTDIYALGILLYEMLSGDVPFRGKDIYETAQKHTSQKVPFLSDLFGNIPISLSNIVAKATAKDVKHRYTSMYAFFKDLDACLKKEEYYAKKINLTGKPEKSFMNFVNSRWGLIIIGLISLIIITLIILIVLLVVLP